MGDGGVCAGEREAVERGVGVAQQMDGVVERGFAALIDGFAQKKYGAAIGSAAGGGAVRRRTHTASRMEAPPLPSLRLAQLAETSSVSQVNGTWMTWIAVEGDERDAVFDVADQRVQDRAEFAIVVEVTRAGAAGFDDDGECEWLGVGVFFDGDLLPHAVVREDEIFGVEAEYDVAVAAGDESGDHDEVGAYGEFDLGSGRLGWWRLLRDGCSDERQK